MGFATTKPGALLQQFRGHDTCDPLASRLDRSTHLVEINTILYNCLNPKLLNTVLVKTHLLRFQDCQSLISLLDIKYNQWPIEYEG